MMVKTKERILSFIADFSAQHGYSPTFREIAEGIGHASVGTVHRHITELKAQGLIMDTCGKSRSIVLRNEIGVPEKKDKKDSDERYVCLKTSGGGSLFLSFVMREDSLEFCGSFCTNGLQKYGDIIACCPMTEEAYDLALDKYAG